MCVCGILRKLRKRYQFSDVGSFTRMLKNLDMPSDASFPKQIYMSNPERALQIFESQTLLHDKSVALSSHEGSC
jgi:hypothetical protein